MCGTVVMTKDRAEAPAVKVISWGQGVVTVGEVPDSAKVDTQLRRLAGPVGLQGFHFEMITPMEALRQRFLQPGGAVVSVQMFRYSGADGQGRRFLWCGQCGHVSIMGFEELSRFLPERCRGCSAELSAEPCEGYHAFGRCGCCPPRVP